MSTWDKVVKILASIGGAIAGLLGEWNTMLTLLAIMMAVDYITGVMVASSGKSLKTENGGISSSVGFLGLKKKGMILLIVLVATVLDKVINTGSMVFQQTTVFYYMANEGISSIENAALLGVPFPPFIKNALEVMKKKGDKPPDDQPPLGI